MGGKAFDIGLLEDLMHGADGLWVEPVEVQARASLGRRRFLQKDEHAPTPGRRFPIQAAGGMKRQILVGVMGGIRGVGVQGVALVVDAQVRADVLFFIPQVAVSPHGNGECLQHGCPRQDEIDELTALHRGFAEGELLRDELGMV